MIIYSARSVLITPSSPRDLSLVCMLPNTMYRKSVIGYLRSKGCSKAWRSHEEHKMSWNKLLALQPCDSVGVFMFPQQPQAEGFPYGQVCCWLSWCYQTSSHFCLSSRHTAGLYLITEGKSSRCALRTESEAREVRLNRGN